MNESIEERMREFLVTRDARWQWLVLSLAAVPLLGYGVANDWEVGEHYEYEWSAGFFDGLAHWVSLLCLVAVVGIGIGMVLDRERRIPHVLTVAASVAGFVGLAATSLATKRIFDSPRIDEGYYFAIEGFSDPYTHLAAPLVVSAIGLVVAIAGTLLLWRCSSQSQRPT